MFQNPTTFVVLCATVVKMLYVWFRCHESCCRRDVSKSHTTAPVRKFTARHGKNPAWFWPESLFRGENGTGQSETRNLSRFATRTRHLSCYCPSGNLARFERDRARLNLSLLKSYVKLNETFVWLYYERECGQNQRDKDKEKFVDYINYLVWVLPVRKCLAWQSLI